VRAKQATGRQKFRPVSSAAVFGDRRAHSKPIREQIHQDAEVIGQLQPWFGQQTWLASQYFFHIVR
jgi:hypothetical protein